VGRRNTFVREYRAIVNVLVKRRKGAGISQWQVARALGIDQSRVSKIERFELRLDIVDYLHFCRAIGLDPCKALKSAKAK
jgi:transcriptional regulator with XRE-family HTH domain